MATGSTTSGSAATNSICRSGLVCIAASDSSGDLGGGNCSGSFSAAVEICTRLNTIPMPARVVDGFIKRIYVRQDQGIHKAGQALLNPPLQWAHLDIATERARLGHSNVRRSI